MMQMIAGTQCWGAGDDDHWDMILNERRDLLAAFLGAKSLGCDIWMQGGKDRKDATWKG